MHNDEQYLQQYRSYQEKITVENNAERMSIEEIYLLWDDDRKSGTPTPMQEWIKQYPKCKDEIMEWAANAPLFDYADTSIPNEEEQTIMLESAKAYFSSNYPFSRSPISSLISLLKKKGFSIPSFAAKLNISVPLLQRLEQRRIQVETVPARLLQSLGDELQTAQESIKEYLSQQPALAKGAFYRADAPPSVGKLSEIDPSDVSFCLSFRSKISEEQISFEEAVRSDQEMSEEQKSSWMES